MAESALVKLIKNISDYTEHYNKVTFNNPIKPTNFYTVWEANKARLNRYDGMVVRQDNRIKELQEEILGTSSTTQQSRLLKEIEHCEKKKIEFSELKDQLESKYKPVSETYREYKYHGGTDADLNKSLNEVFNPDVFLSTPLDQFEIRDIFNFDILDYFHISLTNIGLYLTISAFILLNFNMLTISYWYLINRWSVAIETIYATVYSIVISQINDKKGQSYFPFIYALFMFILINNLMGMIPYGFAPTSHFILTFSLSFTIVLGATILGIIIHKFVFFSLLVPGGCPLPLLPLLTIIEFISYLARNISLGLRLAANILSGHMLLNILSGFTYNIMKKGFFYFILSLLPLSFIIAFSGLELAIAFIQAQVFVVLSSSYIKDALDLH